jgi:hypothetical protein
MEASGRTGSQFSTRRRSDAFTMQIWSAEAVVKPSDREGGVSALKMKSRDPCGAQIPSAPSVLP